MRLEIGSIGSRCGTRQHSVLTGAGNGLDSHLLGLSFYTELDTTYWPFGCLDAGERFMLECAIRLSGLDRSDVRGRPFDQKTRRCFKEQHRVSLGQRYHRRLEISGTAVSRTSSVSQCVMIDTWSPGIACRSARRPAFVVL